MEETSAEQIAAWIDTLRSDLARVTAERDAAVAQSHLSDAAARAIGDDFTRVLRECSALKAEVEAMRGVVEVSRKNRLSGRHNDGAGWYDTDRALGQAIDTLDALRTRKAGG